MSPSTASLRRYGWYLVAVMWVVKCFLENASGRRRSGGGKKGGGASASGTAIDLQAKLHSRRLIKLCFSSFTSYESMLLYALISVLLMRTMLSIVIADVDGQLMKMLVNREKKQLLIGILMWLGVAVPSSFINALIKYLQSRLSLALRAKLTAYTRDKYFEHATYYRVAQLTTTAAPAAPSSPSAITAKGQQPPPQEVNEVLRALQHPEAVLTEDIAHWADRFADLMSSIGKPLVDLAFFSALLYHRLGFFNQFAASVVVWETGKLMKYVRPDYGNIVQERGNLEADLRSRHTRIIAASEEIAFCRGEQRERERLSSTFDRIVNFNQRILKRQIVFHTIEDFVTKYFWSAIGMIQVSIPLLQSRTSAGDNAKYFTTVRRIMVRNGDAVERCLAGIKDAIEFNGYTMRIANLLSGFDEVAAGAAAAAAKEDARKATTIPEAHAGEDGDRIAEGDDGPCAVQQQPHLQRPGDERFSVIIRNVPLRTPQGDLLANELNLALEPGDRMLVLGPNGCGKSSLFRVLCGLWPHTEGYIKKPTERRDLFFVPQRPYLVAGTFRDQVIYPDTAREMAEKGITDADILDIVGSVIMIAPLEAHGGLDAIKEWSEVLSGGEKQRLGIARVFYHRPKFAILDECSNAINVEAEQVIFRKMLNEGMGLITISHRQTLFPFHNKLLTFDGDGGCQFDDVFHFDELSQRSERKAGLMARLQRVLQELGEAWPPTIQTALGGATD